MSVRWDQPCPSIRPAALPTDRRARIERAAAARGAARGAAHRASQGF